MTEQELREILDDVLFGASQRRMTEISEDMRFVHYTSAEAAMKIIQGNEGRRFLWLRNATEMNDFSEVEYGQYCLRETLSDADLAERFKVAFNAIDERIIPDFAAMIDSEFGFLKANTYLLSLSMHHHHELESGRLSMWRAYGGASSVCLVLNTEAFGEQDAYDIVVSPVMYDGPEGFKREFEALIEKAEQNQENLKKIQFEHLRDNLKRAVDFAVLSTKHPSFREEEEWRLIYRPATQPDLIPSIVSLDGIVQTIFLLPLENVDVPDGNSVTGASLPELLDRLIIGPTPNPQLVKLAFVKLLSDAGVVEPHTKVFSSMIPLRR